MNNLSTTQFNGFTSESNTGIQPYSSQSFSYNLQEIGRFYNELSTSGVPQYFKKTDIVTVPKKLKRAIQRHVPIHEKRKINRDIKVAEEKILLFAHQIASFNYSAYLNEENTFKPINTKLIQKILGLSNSKWKVLLSILETGTEKMGPIISVCSTYQANKKSRAYSFTETYLKSGLTHLQLITKKVKDLANTAFLNALNEWNGNIIVNNNLGLYKRLKLPTMDEIEKEAKNLHNSSYKGKTFVYQGHKSENFYGNPKKYVFANRHIKLFLALTSQGLNLPKVGSEKDGYRVYDSFTSTPKWIRKLIKIDGELVAEVDIVTSHPNIAMSLYSNYSATITHDELAEYTRYSRDRVKKAHLSFFNLPVRNTHIAGKKIYKMEDNVLYEYYCAHYPNLVYNIVHEKLLHKDHKVTSRRLFFTEREVMETAIRYLNEQGIYVIYVFDALYCARSVAKIVKQAIDTALNDHGIRTISKIG